MPSEKHHSGHSHRREGAKQPRVFDPSRAALLDDPARFAFLPPDTIFAALDAPRDGVVVDFGAGTGAFSIELARRRPDLRVIALDEQPGMIDLMKAKPAIRELGNVHPMLTGEIGSLMGAADRILAIDVLHEVGDEPLREMVMLLKPEGRALIVDWDSDIERPTGPPRDHTHTLAEARARLAEAGFQTEPIPHLPYHFVLRARPRIGAG
jgi:2-polyprenyl-3-methyl-5-hydroxy-6-metoxy-1,4-benzoquinol methylase